MSRRRLKGKQTGPITLIGLADGPAAIWVLILDPQLRPIYDWTEIAR